MRRERDIMELQYFRKDNRDYLVCSTSSSRTRSKPLDTADIISASSTTAANGRAPILRHQGLPRKEWERAAGQRDVSADEAGHLRYGFAERNNWRPEMDPTWPMAIIPRTSRRAKGSACQ